MPLWISLKVPAALCVLAAASYLAIDRSEQLAGALVGAAVVHVLLTGRARRTYLNARLRARATYDERQARALSQGRR